MKAIAAIITVTTLLVPGSILAETARKTESTVAGPKTQVALRQLIPLRLRRAPPKVRKALRPAPKERGIHRRRSPVRDSIRLGPPKGVGWGSGESMTFSVRLTGVDGGRAALSVGKPRWKKGRQTIVLRGLGETVPFISAFSRMQEDLVTRIDLGGLFPLHTRSDRLKGDKRRNLETDYGRITRQTIQKSGRTFRRNRRISRPVFDPISALFLLRSLSLEPGSKISLTVLSSTALYRADLKIAGRERILGHLGAKDAIRINGVAHRILDDGRPRSGKKPRRFSIWLSADDARIPLKLKGETDLGLVEAKLTSHHPPRRPLQIRCAIAWR